MKYIGLILNIIRVPILINVSQSYSHLRKVNMSLVVVNMVRRWTKSPLLMARNTFPLYWSFDLRN